MANINYLIAQKNRYVSNKNKILSLADTLQMSINELKKIQENQNNAYIIDELSADNNYITKLIERETNIHNNLINNVIPTTNALINRMNYLISDARQKEAMED